MAKQARLLPARAREAIDDSMLIRSAETLGRMIGTLQRQLDGAAKRLSPSADGAEQKSLPNNGSHRNNGSRRPNTNEETARAKPRGRVRAAAGVRRTASGAKKTRSSADRTAKGATKPARAKKSTGGTGSRKAAGKRR